MNQKRKSVADICAENNLGKDEARRISQVFNSQRKHEIRRKEKESERFTLVSMSAFEEEGANNADPGFADPSPGPEERMIMKESVLTLLHLISRLPKKYRIFLAMVLENDGVGIFEENNGAKYGEIKRMAQLSGLSERSVRRYVITIKEMILEMGKGLL